MRPAPRIRFLADAEVTGHDLCFFDLRLPDMLREQVMTAGHHGEGLQARFVGENPQFRGPRGAHVLNLLHAQAHELRRADRLGERGVQRGAGAFWNVGKDEDFFFKIQHIASWMLRVSDIGFFVTSRAIRKQ